MEFKLAYKSYKYSYDNIVYKRFYDDTGLNLAVVLQKYIQCAHKNQEKSKLDLHLDLLQLYDRSVISQLFYSIVDQDLNIPLDEFDDATFRTQWFQNESVDDFSDEYTAVLLNIAYDCNNYVQKNIHVKKKDIKG